MFKFLKISIFLLLILSILSCKNTEILKQDDLISQSNSMQITSSAFKNNEYIPSKYTCDGENINPPLFISDYPENTKSFALIIDDPDAPSGDFVHWVMWNIPAITTNSATDEKIATSIAENSVSPDAIQGKNSFGNKKYGGPCPPSGIHRYFFKVYALDTVLDLDSNASKEILLKAMERNILDKAEITGLYKKD